MRILQSRMGLCCCPGTTMTQICSFEHLRRPFVLLHVQYYPNQTLIILYSKKSQICQYFNSGEGRIQSPWTSLAGWPRSGTGASGTKTNKQDKSIFITFKISFFNWLFSLKQCKPTRPPQKNPYSKFFS